MNIMLIHKAAQVSRSYSGRLDTAQSTRELLIEVEPATSAATNETVFQIFKAQVEHGTAPASVFRARE